MKISQRLLSVAKFVPNNSVVLDIGTDHGFLPIYLLNKNIVNKAILADVNKGPLENAKINLKKYNLEAKCELILSDGFEKIKSDYDTVIIAGMGGNLIASILDDQHQNNKKINFILQPNNGEHFLRSFLEASNFKITNEIIIKENKKYYEILTCCKGTEALTSKQKMFGKYLILEKNQIFKSKWNEQLAYLKTIINKIPSNDEKKAIQKQITLISEVLDEN